MAETKEITTAPPQDKKEQAITVGSQHLDLKNLNLTQLRFIGQTMAASGMFTDAKDANKAIVKVLAGQEIGITPFQAMTNINIIQGKPALGANLYASKVKSHPKYDYRSKLSTTECTITIIEKLPGGKRENIGEFTYSMEDAKNQGLAGKDNWRKYPQNMLFARAISNAVRLFAPDVFNGNLMYTPDELDPDVVVSETGDVIQYDEGEIVKPATPAPEAKPAKADPKPEPEAEKVKLATAPQIKKIFAMLKERGVKEADQAKSIIYQLADVTSTKDLTKDGANDVIDKVENMDAETIAAFFTNDDEAPAPTDDDAPVEGEVVEEI